MRHCFLILTVCALLQAGQARADDVMLGRVVTVDRDRGALTVEPLDRRRDAPAGGAIQAIAVAAGKSMLSSDIFPGQVVRIWGSFAAGGGSCTASRISPASSSGSGSMDSTGVRRRLGMGGGMMGETSSGGSPVMTGPMMKGGHGGGQR